MSNRYIEHIVEPDKLLLSWQTATNRQRMFVAELVRNRDTADLIYQKDSEDFKLAKSLGFDGYPGFKIEKDIHENVLGSFMKRLPPRSRGDFHRFLDAIRIKSDAEISDFAILGYSRAKLPDDDFTVIHPFDTATPPFELMMPVQGYRYRANDVPYGSLTTEMNVNLEPEPSNKFDSKAVKVLLNGKHAGYLCRGLLQSYHHWVDSGFNIKAFLERINGTQERPQIYIYIAVSEK